jgi:virulence factor lipase-like protein
VAVAPPVSPPPSSTEPVAPQFNLSTLRQSPFPSDFYSVADSGQNTGLRVSLPKPDCNTKLSDCQDIDVLNQLDGFSAQTRLEIPFNGAIDPNSVNSSNLFFISLGDQVPGGDPGGERIGVNQVVWDPASLTLFVESDKLLEQHTRYIAVVTNGIHDSLGNPIITAVGFTKFLGQQQEPGSQLAVYESELQTALNSGAVSSVPPASIAAATVFTTQSVTSFLQKVRDQIKASTPAPADFLLGTLGERTVFAKSAVSSIVFNEEDTTAPTFSQPQIFLNLLDVVPSSVGTIAYGKYKSPDYQIAPAVLPDLPTRTGVPQAQQMTDLYFTLYLPASAKPATGWPVAIYSGHFKDLEPSRVASIMAAHGIATIGINAVGDGGGPLGSLVVTAGGTSVTLPEGGRAVDVNGDGIFESQEGCTAAAPRAILLFGDCRRQMTVDLMQLVRVIQVGVDVDGDGIADLDPSRIYSFGASFGGTASAMLLAVEPDVHAGVPVVFGGHSIDQVRLTDHFPGEGFFGALLYARTPSLLNLGPPDLVNGIFPFNDNFPLRNQPPVINTVAGAIEIQELESRMRWVQMSGDPAGNAPYLRREPLAGSSPKSVIMQFAKGDVSQPNPVSTATLRAGQLADRTTYFRNDLAFAADPNFPEDPHEFLLPVHNPDPAIKMVAVEAQTQIAIFFASDGQTVINPAPCPVPVINPVPCFEVPIAGPLPEDLNFLPGAMPF